MGLQRHAATQRSSVGLIIQRRSRIYYSAAIAHLKSNFWIPLVILQEREVIPFLCKGAIYSSCGPLNAYLFFSVLFFKLSEEAKHASQIFNDPAE